jgi:hypothetical protein
VIGPNADAPQLGGYAGFNPKSVGILAGVRAAAGRGTSVEYAEGVRIVEGAVGRSGYLPMVRSDSAQNAKRISEAVEVARRADVVLLVVGDVLETTRESVQFDAPGDRSTLGLFGDQNALAPYVADFAAFGGDLQRMRIDKARFTCEASHAVARELMLQHFHFVVQRHVQALAQILRGDVFLVAMRAQ